MRTSVCRVGLCTNYHQDDQYVDILTGSSPYPGLTGPQVMQRIQRGYRMEKPRHCSDDL